MRAFVARHRALVAASAVLAVVLAVVVAVWFQPQRLLYDDTVNDPLPAEARDAVDEAASATTSATARPGATVLARGMFRSRAHDTSGDVRVLRLGDGSRILRLEDFDTDNGPDLFVYLSEAAPDAPNGDFDSGYVSLGRLKGNKGDQSYAVPAGVDLSRFESVVIWCKRFTTAFGSAPLA